MAALSQMVIRMERSGIREIMDLAGSMEEVIHLEVGEPLFDTPVHITEAAFIAARAGFTKYTPNKGLLSLRETIADRMREDYSLSITPNNVVVTVGGVGAVAIAVRALVDYGDEVLIPDPGWPNYESIIKCAGAVPKRYMLKRENGFLPDLAVIEKAITLRTKVLILNSPSNPLGVMIQDELLRDLVKLARRKDIYIISDEVYEKIVYVGKHTTALSFDLDERVISIFSFSKTYAMTGWRVGYAVAPELVADQLTKLQEAYVSCACSVSQKAAEAAIKFPQDCVEEMRRTYHDNLKTATKILDNHKIPYLLPQGAFYLWVDVQCKDSPLYARNLLKEKKVAVAPGTTFGSSGKNYIRISLASSEESIKEGLLRLSTFKQQ